ncbi:MAG: Crp/Fnr family transcriptional regulator [Bacteroidales bacterium]|nr:Crp/Fnr family transcriptional regulator [Bacteroidales bacterium]
MENTSCLPCKSESNCFGALSDSELEMIDKSKVVVTFKKGETIAKQGSFASGLIYIKEGMVKLYKEGPDNNNLILNIFGSDELVGISSIYGDNVFNYSIVAIEKSEIYLIELAVLKELIQTNAKFATAVLQRSNRNTLRAYNQMYSLTHKQLNGRMASALIFLANEVYQSNRFKLTLSRKDLADFTGMSTMGAIRVLNTFKTDKIISDEKGYIEILDYNAIKVIAKVG